MVLDDLFENFGGTGVVPHFVGINDGNGTIFTNAQAIGFGAEDASPLAKTQLFETAFEEVPGGKTGFFRTTFGFGLIAAEKNVPLDPIDP